MVYQSFDDLNVPTGTGSMKRKDAVKDRVDRLTVVESVFDETDVASGGSRMEAETGD